MLCDSNGINHNFHIYTGKILPVFGCPDLGASANMELRLISIIKSSLNLIVCFDNWFNSLPLIIELAKRSIYCLGTIRLNQTLGCTFSFDTDMRKKGRGYYEERCATIDGVDARIVKRHDKRYVQLVSTCSDAVRCRNRGGGGGRTARLN